MKPGPVSGSLASGDLALFTLSNELCLIVRGLDRMGGRARSYEILTINGKIRSVPDFTLARVSGGQDG